MLRRLHILILGFVKQFDLNHYSFNPANTIHWANAGLMLASRLRLRPNIKPALDQCLVSAGIGITNINSVWNQIFHYKMWLVPEIGSILNSKMKLYLTFDSFIHNFKFSTTILLGAKTQNTVEYQFFYLNNT